MFFFKNSQWFLLRSQSDSQLFSSHEISSESQMRTRPERKSHAKIYADWHFLTSIDDRQHDVKSHFGVFIHVNWLDASIMMLFDDHGVFWSFLTIFANFWRRSKNWKKLFTKIDEKWRWRQFNLASIDIKWLQLHLSESIDVHFHQ